MTDRIEQIVDLGERSYPILIGGGLLKQRGILDPFIGDADVLVVGSHERRGLDRITIGSIARRLMREAPCPVLVVNPPTPTETVETEK